jgi:hypothetical protein
MIEFGLVLLIRHPTIYKLYYKDKLSKVTGLHIHARYGGLGGFIFMKMSGGVNAAISCPEFAG